MTKNNFNTTVPQLDFRINNLNETINKCAKSFESFGKNINQLVNASNQLANIYCKKQFKNK
jgi:ABC-type transporter Mla subunit MlaD